VWLNGDRRSGFTVIGSLIGVGLWLMVQLLPTLRALLDISAIPPTQALLAMGLLVLTLIVMGPMRAPPSSAADHHSD
jgi:hypothetical protein